VKKTFLFIGLFCCYSLVAWSQVINSAYVKALQARFPPQKSDFCADCYIWVNPYFKAIVDVGLRESLVTYGEFDRRKDSLVEVLDVPRTGIYASWHPAFGFQNENKFYVDINKGITEPLAKHAKGHYAAWILCAWAVDGALLSDTYDFNEGIENQGQNEGTELEVEYLTRALVGNPSAAKRIHYSGPLYDRVDYWKGSWGTQEVFDVDGIHKNFSAVYWNLLQYGDHLVAYWFPNNISASRGADQYIIDVDNPSPNKPGLIQRLGFDPRKVLNETMPAVNTR
jgi:hypothetical protein